MATQPRTTPATDDACELLFEVGLGNFE